jgi:hypothetical protein
MVTAKQIQEILATTAALNTKVNNIIALANEMGGHDNITVVLLKHNRTKQPAQAANGAKVKKTVKAKPETTDPTPLLSSGDKEQGKPEKPGSDNTFTEAATTKPPKKSGSSSKWLRWNALVVLLLAASCWFFFSQNNTTPTIKPDNTTNNTPEVTGNEDTARKRPASIFSGEHAAPSGPVVETAPDTMRLSATKNITAVQHYADSAGKNLLLVPAKEKANHFAAVEINKSSGKVGDTIVIKNIRMKGFETGISVRIPVHVKLENTFFENVKYPVSYQVKPDTTNKSLSVQMINTEMQ